MAPRNQSKSKSGRWYKSSEVLLLAYISLQANLSNSQPNDHIKELSASAAEFLSSELNRPYKARHIKEKVERLWHRYGRNKSLSVNEIYEFGANPRTLPRLETYRKGIFVEIGWKTSVLKRYDYVIALFHHRRLILFRQRLIYSDQTRQVSWRDQV